MYYLKPVFSLTVVAIMGVAFALPAYATYVGNDPVNTTDPTGKVLQVVGGTEEFKNQVIKDINTIATQNGTTSNHQNAAMINQLINSKNVHTIRLPSATAFGQKTGSTYNSTQADNGPNSSTPGVGSGTEVGYDPNNNTTRSGEVRPPVVGLAHELGHSQEMDSGTFQHDPVMQDMAGQIVPPEGITPGHEKNPLKTENRLRRALGVQEKKCYTRTCG